MKPGRPASRATLERITRIVSMEPGQSFFVAGAKQSQFGPIRKIARDFNITLSIHEVECDEKEKKAGVRVYRR